MPLLTKIKNRGSLKTPSTDVAYICKTAEKFIRHHNIKKANMHNILTTKIFNVVQNRKKIGHN
jgi:hypothetical protein